VFIVCDFTRVSNEHQDERKFSLTACVSSDVWWYNESWAQRSVVYCAHY